MARRALGKGLSALIPTEQAAERTVDAEEMESDSVVEYGEAPATGDGLKTVPIEQIRGNPWQPRGTVDQAALAELAESIKEKGLLQPVLVRKTDGGYELVAGERRFEASKMAGLDRVPVVVRDASNREMLEIALVENLQREDLNPIDEAAAFKRLREEFGLTQEEIAKRVGKDRASIANQMRLLNLPAEVQDYVSRGTLSAGHGRALLSIQDPAKLIEIGRLVAGKGLSVRETERLAQRKQRAKRQKGRPPLAAELSALEERLREHLATKISIKPSGKGGTIEVNYYSVEDLERILEAMGAWHTPH